MNNIGTPRFAAWIGAAALLGSMTTSAIALQGPSQDAAPPVGSTPYPGGKWEPGPARYGSETQENVSITMDDGVVLKAAVSYPTDLRTGLRAAGKFPVIVEHTSYATTGRVVMNPLLPEHGYIYVRVRMRGAGQSGGDVQVFSPRDGQDGKAVIDWAAHRLPESDGRIGMFGCSYPAGLTLTDASHVGPGSPVKAVIAACMGLGGLNRETWMVAGLPTVQFRAFNIFGPGLLGSASAEKIYKEQNRSVLEGEDAAYDRDYWGQRVPLSWAKRIADSNIPVLLWTGWTDRTEIGVIQTYAALQNAAKGRPYGAPMSPDQPVDPRFQLVVGDGDHGEALNANVFLQWFDTWVRGIDTGINRTTTPMHLFERGTRRWVNLARYPVTQHYTPWYLGPQGEMGERRPAAGQSAPLKWAYPHEADGKLSFTSAPLAEGGSIAGPMSATLYARSSNSNMVLIGRMYDVAPDGSSTLITQGAVLGSQRAIDPDNSWKDAAGLVTRPWPTLKGDDYLKPDTPYRLDMALAPRQWGVRPGHRIRFEITSRTDPKTCPPDGSMPPKLTADPCDLTRPQRETVPGGTYRILWGAKSGSSLNLPLVPLSTFQAVPAGKVPQSGEIIVPGLDTSLPRTW